MAAMHSTKQRKPPRQRRLFGACGSHAPNSGVVAAGPFASPSACQSPLPPLVIRPMADAAAMNATKSAESTPEVAAKKKLSLFEKFAAFKEALHLQFPGSVENLHKESKNVANLSHFFEGGKADLSKGLSPNFQISHSFFMGSATLPASYHFGALYATERCLMHGMISGDGTMQGKFHVNASKNLVFKVQQQLSPKQSTYDMMQLEADYSGKDYSLNAKAFNPSPVDGTGVLTAGFLQSVTPKLAIGSEFIFQKLSKSEQDFGLSLFAKMFDEKRILTLSLQHFAMLQASYWYRVSPKVELGSELHLGCVGKRDGLATIACKLDFKQAIVRGQFDTTGKVALVLEEKLAPGFSFVVCGELDHLKGGSRFGVGINMES